MLDYGTKYEYDKLNRLRSEIKYDEYEKLVNSIEYSYAKNSNRIIGTSEEHKRRISNKECEYIYSENKLISIKCITTEELIKEGSKSESISKISSSKEFKYDSNGNKIEVLRTGNNGIQKLTVKYVYNAENKLSAIYRPPNNFNIHSQSKIKNSSMSPLRKVSISIK